MYAIVQSNVNVYLVIVLSRHTIHSILSFSAPLMCYPRAASSVCQGVDKCASKMPGRRRALVLVTIQAAGLLVAPSLATTLSVMDRHNGTRVNYVRG